MKKKGFTLIELLAVIVILAIIALIATPMIMDVIEKARRGAAEESGNGYIEAVDWYQLQEKLDSSMYQIPMNTIIKINACETTCLRDVIEVKGDKPRGTEDYIKLNTKGIIETGKLTFGNYEVTIKNGKVESVNKVGETPAEIVFEPTLATGIIHHFTIDSEGTLWGIEVFKDAEGEYQNRKIKEDTRFISASIGSGSSGIFIYAIDESKNLWEISLTEASDGPYFTEIGESKIIKKGTKFQSVSASQHTMAIDIEGNLWGWGNNINGQLGDGTTENKTEPIQIKEGTKFKSVSAGANRTMAIDVDGNLWGWGLNTDSGISGLIGTDSEEKEITDPVQIKEGTKFKSVSAGMGHTMAIDVEGNLWGWGINHSSIGVTLTGLLGIGTEESSKSTPVQIKAGTKFQSVSAGMTHTMAIDTEGNLWGWGTNNVMGVIKGMIGDGTETNRLSPVPIKEGTKFKSVSLGMLYDTMAIDIDGNLYNWGTLLDATTARTRLEPVIVMQLQK